MYQMVDCLEMHNKRVRTTNLKETPNLLCDLLVRQNNFRIIEPDGVSYQSYCSKSFLLLIPNHQEETQRNLSVVLGP